MGEYTGQPYRPSNGSEGMWFDGKFCGRCIHEKFMHTQKHGDQQCDIYNRMVLREINEPDYPKEIVYDQNDHGSCTAFVKWDWGNNDDDNGFNEPPIIEPDDPNQLVLPFELESIEKQIVEYSIGDTIK